METLLCYVRHYKEYYVQPIQSEFHCLVSLITSQRVRFSTGQKIRRQLYDLCGYPLTIENIKNLDLTTIQGLTLQQIETITCLINGYDYNNIKGIGNWTIKGMMLLRQLDPHINLYEDKYICKRVIEYIGQDCKQFIQQANDEQSDVSYFLWRIKPQGITKVKNNLCLDRDDFI